MTRISSHAKRNNMKFTLLFLVSALLAVGCNGKKDDAPAAGPAPTGLPSLNAPTTPVDGAPTPTTPTTSSSVPVADVPVDLEALSKAVFDYCKKTQANPGSLDEVAKAGYIKVLPKLPPGKEFYIDDVTYKVGIRDIVK